MAITTIWLLIAFALGYGTSELVRKIRAEYKLKDAPPPPDVEKEIEEATP